MQHCSTLLSDQNPNMMYWLALGSAILTWPLISFGAFVRLKGAGLACPDWPLCYGQLIPPPGYEIALEVGHRFVATILGMIILSMVVLAFSKDHYRHYRRISLISLLMVSFQGILGGLTVTMQLNPYIVTGHLIGGNLTFAILVYFAWRAYQERGEQAQPQRFRWTGWHSYQRKIALMAVILSVILISGGKNSTTYSGYSCSAFPGCHSGAEFSIAIPAPDGSPNVPEAFVGQFMPHHFNEWIHMLHRFFAIFGGSWLMYLAWTLRRQTELNSLRHCGVAILFLIPTEVLIGIVNALYRIPVPVSALHTAIAATLVGILAYALSEASLLSHKAEGRQSQTVPHPSTRQGVPA